MPVMTQSLTDIHIDVLREIGNIGAGNAMTALATMVERTVDMSVPHVGIIPLADFTQLAGGPEALAAGIYMPVTGDAPGHVAFVLPEATALRLVDHLMYRSAGESAEFGEIECSALMEVGNILAASYLTAMCELTGLNLAICPPSLAIDMTAAILSTIAAEFDSGVDRAVTIVSHILEDNEVLEGYFIYIPEPDSLSVILHALNI
jgi:chemotaxis protein CheC